jgi:uncharacterized protein
VSRVAWSLCLIVAFTIGCRGGDSRSAPATKSLGTSEVSSVAIAPEPAAGGADPWAVGTRDDDPPSLAERRRFADEACPRVTAPYFYRIEKNGRVSHILGTRHLGVSLAKFPPSVHTALASAKLAVFEIAPGDDTDPSGNALALRDELGPAQWAHFTTLVGTDTARALERATPAAAILMMTVLYEDMTAMLDLEIQRQVEAARIPTRGLETSAFQDAILDKLLDLRMLRAVVSTTDSRAKIADESRRDLAEYCAGTDDSPGMDDTARADLLRGGYTSAEIDRMDEELVFSRNADWIPKLEPLLDRGGAFIAVGADHLTGDRGVIALLQKRGYRTTRLD